MSERKRTAVLLLLTLVVFAVGTAELLPMGMLIPIAGETGVSLSAAGLLVTGYALGVVIGGPLLSVLTAKWPRKRLIGAFLSTFVVGGALCAFAPSYGVLMTGRIISSLAHGTLFGVIVVAARDLASPGREGRNIAMIGTGLNVAVILGAPLGTLIGQAWGWRSPFLIVTALSLASLPFLIRHVPSAKLKESTSLRTQLAVVGRPSFVLVLLTTVFATAGTFAAFTYVAPLLEKVSGFSSESISALLLVFGLGSTIGNLFGGRQADRRLMPALFGGLALLPASMAAFALAGPYPAAAVAALFIWGAAAYSIIAPLNMLGLRQAGNAQELASTLNICAFNLGNALGSFVGGWVLDSRLGLTAIPWAASLVAAVAIGLAVWNVRLAPRADRISMPPAYHPSEGGSCVRENGC
ncbi:MFS transporter [Cohnella zeiphila]|uniref:MFS transporter n=1 Tax=Cohnella zeiphila TaxID=2761120 RepID=A0A7X0SG83_9BACL|nr:MFS transporter [Cohnella zeiphila]MBB6729410.1 MFS transporter [Cohnella zeiphila]